MARDRVWATAHPVSLNVSLPAAPYFTQYGLRVNQVVPVTVVEGQLRVVGFFRIESMTLDGNDFLSLVLIPAEVKGTNLV
jgi:hypothetical protein